MGSSQSKHRRHDDVNKNDYDTRDSPSHHNYQRKKHPTGAQRLREDADRLRRTRRSSREYQREVRPDTVYDARYTESDVAIQHIIDNLRKYQREDPSSNAVKSLKKGPPRRLDEANVKVIAARPTVTDKRRQHQRIRSFNQSSKSREPGDRYDVYQTSTSTGENSDDDEDDYNQYSRPAGNYNDGDDYNQVSKRTGRYGDGDDYNQASKSQGRYEDEDAAYNQTSQRPYKY